MEWSSARSLAGERAGQLDQGPGSESGTTRVDFVIAVLRTGRAGDVQVRPRQPRSELPQEQRRGDAAWPGRTLPQISEVRADLVGVVVAQRHPPPGLSGGLTGSLNAFGEL